MLWARVNGRINRAGGLFQRLLAGAVRAGCILLGYFWLGRLLQRVSAWIRFCQSTDPGIAGVAADELQAIQQSSGAPGLQPVGGKGVDDRRERALDRFTIFEGAEFQLLRHGAASGTTKKKPRNASTGTHQPGPARR